MAFQNEFIVFSHCRNRRGWCRPKALIHENYKAYLAKFNLLTADVFNNAKVELACLQMAKDAGLNVLSGHVRNAVNGRDVLMLDRFDVVIKITTDTKQIPGHNYAKKISDSRWCCRWCICRSQIKKIR